MKIILLSLINPTASTISTSLGAGWSIQDGSGVGGTDVLFDIRGAATGVANRSFATNLNDIRIRETGTISAPNGVRLIAENDIVDVLDYIHSNPVSKKWSLVENFSDYKHSSAAYYVHKKKVLFPLFDYRDIS